MKTRRGSLHQGILSPDPNVEDQEIAKILATLGGGSLTRDELEASTGIHLKNICWRIGRLLREDRVHVAGYRESERTGRTNEILAVGPAPTTQLTLTGRFW
jgi:hypothetical protein